MRSRFVPGLVLVLMAASTSPLLAQQKAATSAPAKSLYDRLGGLYNIAAVVDDFIDRVYVDATINANPAINKARKTERKAGLKVHLVSQVCMVTGGPCKYTGLDMKTAHKDFGLTDKEWDALVADFKASLDKFKVPAVEQQELIGIVATTKPDIVVGPAVKK